MNATPHWDLRRNCLLSPHQLILCCLAAPAIDALIAVGLWSMGYPVVAVFTVLETLVIVAALIIYGQHACDRDLVSLADGKLVVEQHDGGQVRRTEMAAAWVRVSPPAGPGGLVALSERGAAVHVGRHVPPPMRQRVASEIRQALANVAPPAESLGTADADGHPSRQRPAIKAGMPG